MTDIPNITPTHSPISLAQAMLDECKADPKIIGGFFMLVDEDGLITRDACGVRCADLVWALERTKLNVIREFDD